MVYDYNVWQIFWTKILFRKDFMNEDTTCWRFYGPRCILWQICLLRYFLCQILLTKLPLHQILCFTLNFVKVIFWVYCTMLIVHVNRLILDINPALFWLLLWLVLKYKVDLNVQIAEIKNEWDNGLDILIYRLLR